MDEKKRKPTLKPTTKKSGKPDKTMQPKGDLTHGTRSPQSGTPGADNTTATGGTQYSV